MKNYSKDLRVNGSKPSVKCLGLQCCSKFVAVNVNLSLAIHFSSSFLLWLIIVITLHEDLEQFSFECGY